MEIRYDDEYGNKLILTAHASNFSIDPTNIDSELCSLGRVMTEYAEVESILKTEVERKENQLARMEAEMDTALRTKAQSEGTKLTEKTIENLIKGNTERNNLIEDLRISRHNYNLMKWVMRSIASKKDCLIALSYRERDIIKSERY